MGKTYVEIVKYLIRANLEVDGIVEKPDIVGAVFGQTEGLLGDELDLRELQKNGRIGRIEVDTQVRGGKCIGTVTVPSSLDMVETSILAAALEVVDRVGPCDAKISVQRIEDTRNLKRKQVLGRARDLLKNLVTGEMPESKELAEMVREELKVSEVVSYGPDNLSAGPAIDSTEEIIVVEGRADVINLLRNGITNVVAIGGARVGKGIAELIKKKQATAFLDGDRGGDIILKELMNASELDYVARAPVGHEVEELSRKEIIQCLRRKVPIEQVSSSSNGATSNNVAGSPERMEQAPAGIAGFGMEPKFEGRRESRERTRSANFERHEKPVPNRMVERREPQVIERTPAVRPAPIPVPEPQAVVHTPVPAEVEQRLKTALKELEGSLKARIYNDSGSVLAEVPIRDVMTSLNTTNGAHSVVLDGIVTQRLLDAANGKGAKFVAGIRAGNQTTIPSGIGIVLSE